MAALPDHAQQRRAPSYGSRTITISIFDLEIYLSNAKQKKRPKPWPSKSNARSTRRILPQGEGERGVSPLFTDRLSVMCASVGQCSATD
jgi:hypothetical protein